MIGRADIEGSKSDVAMNAWPPQASYPCGNFSGTSSFTRRRLTPPPFRDEAHASWYDIRPKPNRIHLNRGRVKSSRSSTDSGLEAFSHNPTNDSFEPLAFQLSPLPAI